MHGAMNGSHHGGAISSAPVRPQAQVQPNPSHPGAAHPGQHPSIPPVSAALPPHASPIHPIQGRGNTGPPVDSSNATPRQLNVEDALSYLELVKHEYLNQPGTYHRFLEIMKDFKNQE
jgi:paired amphipathic helix protein Sin3a